MTSRSSSFRTNVSAPASSARSSAPLSSEAVSRRHGTSRKTASRRMCRITVAPSMPGSTPSTTMASGRCAPATRRPSSPVAAVSTRWPADSNAVRSSSRNVALSSITRMVVPPAAAPCRALKQLLHLREQVADVVRLADILVGAGLEPSNSIPHLRLRGEHHDHSRDAGRRSANLLQQIDAIAIRKKDVQNDDAGRDARQHLSSVGRGRTQKRD